MPKGFGDEETPTIRSDGVATRRWRLVLRPTLVFLAYLAGYITLDVATEGIKGPLNNSLWFPPVGLTFVLLLVFGRRYTPAVAVVFLLHLILFREGLSYPVAILFAIPILYAVLYAGGTDLLVRGLKIDPRLTRMRDVAWFVGIACFLVPFLGAVMVVSGMVLSGYVPSDAYWANLLGFWAGDATGIGVVTSFLLVAARPFGFLWTHRPREPAAAGAGTGFRAPSRQELPEVGLQVLALVLSLAAAYGGARGFALDYAYLAFAPLAWVALRGGFERTTAAVLLINVGVVMMVSGTAGDIDSIPLQFGLMALTLVGLLLGGQTSERDRVEEALREGEERYRAVVEQSAEAIWLFDPDTKEVIESNTAFQEMLGYSEEELRGLTNYDFVAHSDEDVDAAVRRKEEGRDSRTERKYRRKDGTLLDVEVDGALISYRGKEVMCSAARDLTKRKEAEEALRESEERFRSLIQNSSDLITILEADGTIRYESPAVEWMLGYGLEERIGKSAFDYIHPEDVEMTKGSFAKALDRPAEVQERVEHRVRHKDGSWRRLEVTRNNLLGDPAVGAVVANSRDVTERKEAEEALKESEARFRTIFEGSPVGMTLADPDRGLVEANPAYQEMVGYGEEELSGKNLADITHPEDVEEDVAVQREVVRGEGDRRQREKRYVRKDGEIVWARVTFSAARDEAGELRSTIGVVEDITERKEAEERLKESHDLLRSVMEGTTDAVFVKDFESRYLMINHAGAEMLGKSVEEVIGKTDAELFCEEDGREVMEGDREVMASGETRTIEDTKETAEGVTRTYSVTKGPYRDAGGDVVGMFGVARDITERKELEERLEHQAFHDSLTGLSNRALLVDRLKQALARARRRAMERGVALLFLDLDGFKVVNDSLGHETGDELLVGAARRLNELARSGDTVARLGGDEFCVLLEDASAEEAVGVAERILVELKDAPFILGEGERQRRVFVGASIGIALSHSHHHPSDLLKEADLAMYRAKEEGKGRYAVFEPHLSERASERARLEGDLRRAIEHGELELYYQPQVCLRTGKILWMEALLRWEHPERGLLLPNEFVPLAEETGLIVPIGLWTLEEALRQGRRWREEWYQSTSNEAKPPRRGADDRPPPPGVCINLSARQLFEERFVEEVRGLLVRTETDPRSFGLEVTESVLMEGERALSALEELRGMGITFSIDDFGTGYSSLSYLKKFPADHVKIDCSFVEGLGKGSMETTMISGMMTLAHATGKAVVAECVESPCQAALLKELGCEMGQGYLFGEPLPPGEAARLAGGYNPERLLSGRPEGSSPSDGR